MMYNKILHFNYKSWGFVPVYACRYQCLSQPSLWPSNAVTLSSFIFKQDFLLKNWKAPHLNNNIFSISIVPCRCLYLSSLRFDKSKLEDSLKEKKKQKKVSYSAEDSRSSEKTEEISVAKKPSGELSEAPKPSLWSRIVAEVKHYWNGFKLLGLDVRIASRSLWKLLRGKTLLRRERNQFRRALSDIFRLLPFSVFIIIPFAEIALPFVLKLFPGLLPSTFETSSKKERRLKQELKVKLEMAKFLQDTVEDMAVHTSGSKKERDAAKKFVEFFKKTRNDDLKPTNEEILQYAKLFRDELTLDNIDRPQLIALSRLIQVPAVGTNELLRFLIQMKLNRLHRDDELIMEEGVDSLTTAELVAACQARGMRALGVPRKRLKQQLSEWVDLHVTHDVPSSLLLLSRVLYLPDTVSTEEKVKAVISTLPETVADKAEVMAAELNLERVDNTARYKAAKQEQAEIISEATAKAKQEKAAKEQPATEVIPPPEPEELALKVDKTSSPVEKETVSDGPVLKDTARVIREDNTITQKDIDEIDDAITKIQPDTAAVKTELDDLREDVQEYKSDMETLAAEVKHDEHTAELRDTRAGTLIQNRIDKMIERMEIIIDDLETGDNVIRGVPATEIAVHDLVTTLQSLTKLPEEKLNSIFETLDTNNDGHIDVVEASNVIKMLNQEDVEVTTEQLEQIVQLLEEQLVDKKEAEGTNGVTNNDKNP